MVKSGNTTAIALAGLVGGLVGALGTLLLGAEPERTAAGSTSALSADLTHEFAQLHMDLAELLEALRERPMSLHAEPAATQLGNPARTPIGAPTEGLVPALAALEETLRATFGGRAALASGGAAATVGLRSNAPPPARDREAILALREQFATSSREVLETYFGLGYDQLYARFGTPDQVYTHDNGSLSWYYEEQVNGEDEDLTFTLVDGFVIRVRD